jgi:hypothetical protein
VPLKVLPAGHEWVVDDVAAIGEGVEHIGAATAIGTTTVVANTALAISRSRRRNGPIADPEPERCVDQFQFSISLRNQPGIRLVRKSHVVRNKRSYLKKEVKELTRSLNHSAREDTKGRNNGEVR